MKCILCDRCKKVVEDERKIKVVTYARPLNSGVRCPAPADNRQMNDHIWTKELCSTCAEEFENFMDMETAPSKPVEPEQPEQPTEPEEGTDTGDSFGEDNGTTE